MGPISINRTKIGEKARRLEPIKAAIIAEEREDSELLSEGVEVFILIFLMGF